MKTNIQISPLDRACELLGGKVGVAKALGIKAPSVHEWYKRIPQIPAERAIPLALATNWSLRPHDLRPDLYPNPEDGMPKEKNHG